MRQDGSLPSIHESTTLQSHTNYHPLFLSFSVRLPHYISTMCRRMWRERRSVCDTHAAFPSCCDWLATDKSAPPSVMSIHRHQQLDFPCCHLKCHCNFVYIYSSPPLFPFLLWVFFFFWSQKLFLRFFFFFSNCNSSTCCAFQFGTLFRRWGNLIVRANEHPSLPSSTTHYIYVNGVLIL